MYELFDGDNPHRDKAVLTVEDMIEIHKEVTGVLQRIDKECPNTLKSFMTQQS